MTQQPMSSAMGMATPFSVAGDKSPAGDAVALLSRVGDLMGDAVVVIDSQQRIVLTNPAFTRLFGFAGEEVRGLAADFLYIDDADLQQPGPQPDRDPVSAAPAEVRCRRRDGSEFWAEQLITRLAGPEGAPAGAILLHRDLTPDKAAEAAWCHKSAEFDTLFELSVVGSAQTDPASGRFLRVNRKLCEITGYSADELLRLSLRDIIHPDDRERDWKALHSAMAGTTGRHVLEQRHRRKDGSIAWIRVQASPLGHDPDALPQAIALIQDITLQKQAEASLHRQLELQALMTKIMATVPGVVCSYQLRPDGSACMPYASAALEELSGLRAEDVRDDTSPLLARIHADDIGRINASIAASATTLKPWREQFRICHPDKGELWIDGHAVPQRELDGRVLWYGYFSDVSARQRVEQALRQSEADLRRAQAVAETGSWHLNVRNDTLHWSDEIHRLFGIPSDVQLTYEIFLAAVHAADRDFVDRSWQAALRGAPYDIEHRIVVAGETRWVRERAELEFDAQGNLLGGYGTTQDISGRKRSEAALAASESRFRLAMEAVAGVVYDWDRRTGSTYWSSGLGRIFGVIGLNAESGRSWWRDNVHPEDLPRVRGEIFRQRKAGRSQIQLEYRMRHSAGHWLHVSDCAHIVDDAAGRSERIVGSLTDISARKQAEANLRQINDSLETQVAQRTAEAEARAVALLESERFARATIDALNFALCVLDASGHIIAVNKAWREFAVTNGGRDGPFCEGADYLAICDAATTDPIAARVAAAIRAAIAGDRRSFSIEYECHAPGEQRWFVMKMSAFTSGGPLRLVIKHENITARKLAEEERQESARRLKRLAEHLETVREEQSATIAREVHDELGGTLTMAKLGLATLADDLQGSAAHHDSLLRILDQVNAALQTVKRISADLRPATLDTLGFIATIKWYAARFSQMTGIDTDLRLPKYVRLSRSSSTAAFRIVQEALTNVAKHADASRVGIEIDKIDGQLLVEIRDNGVGLDEANQLQQESFGVIGMLERARNLGGQLAITSTPGAGTCLILRIPLDDSDEDGESES